VEVVASLSQGRTGAAQCGLFTYKSVPVIFEPPCITKHSSCLSCRIKNLVCLKHDTEIACMRFTLYSAIAYAF